MAECNELLPPPVKHRRCVFSPLNRRLKRVWDLCYTRLDEQQVPKIFFIFSQTVSKKLSHYRLVQPFHHQVAAAASAAAVWRTCVSDASSCCVSTTSKALTSTPPEAVTVQPL